MANTNYFSDSSESVIKRFKSAWDESPIPNLSDYLPNGFSVAERRQLLLELIVIDQEYRWKQIGHEYSTKGLKIPTDTTASRQLPRYPLIEDYCSRFEELGQIARLPFSVIANEYQIRNRSGRSATPQEYIQRFPHLAEELSRIAPFSADAQQPLVQATISQSAWDRSAKDSDVPVERDSDDQPLETLIEKRSSPTETLSLQTIHPWKQASAESGEPKSPFQTTMSLRPREVNFSGRERLQNWDYEVGQILGEGGMGSVFRARQGSIDRDVAIKMIKTRSSQGSFGPETIEKFLAEAVITGALEHPNVIPIYDVGLTTRGEPFYAMKEIRGAAWSRTIDSAGEDDNLNTLLRIADAIGFAHAIGIVHRDLKPDNVMLGEFGEVLVLDWGLAMPLPQFKNPRIAFAEGLAGTPAYMAPEMAVDNSGKVGPWSDIYLLGALLFRCLTGRPPHAGRRVTECLQAAERNDIIATDRNDELMQIARKAMASQPEDRYQSVREFQRALREYRSHAESHRLTDFAQQELQTARDSSDYRRFEKAVLAFEQAAELWSGNHPARESLIIARCEYARTAFERHDYELAEQQLDAQQPTHAELLPRIRQAKQERDARIGRVRRLKQLAAGLAALVLVTVSIAAAWINRSRNQERLAKDDAVRRFQQSQEAIARITSISDQIRHLPRMQAVRKNLLKMVAGYYQELTNAPSQNPAMQLELARSLIRLGDVHSQLAEHRAAIQAWSEAMRFAGGLRRSEFADQATPLVRQAQLRAVQSYVALHEFREARGILEDLERELQNTGASANSELAQTMFQRGLLLREMGETSASIESLLRAETIYRRLHKADSSVAVQRSLATTLSTLGQLLQRNGEADKAVAKIEQALAISSELYERDASNPDLLEGVATSQIDLANALRGSGHEPMAVYEQAIEAYDELRRARPEVPHYHLNLAIARINLAQLHHHRGEAEQAQQLATDGINGYIRLNNEYPEDVRYQDLEAEARITFAEVLRDRLELELANGVLDEAASHLDQQVAQHDLPQYREQQALIASLRGQLQVLADDPPAAREHFQKAVADWDQLLQQDTSQAPRYRDSAAWTRFHFANLLWKSGQLDEAMAQVDAAIHLREQLPANAVWDESFAWLCLQSPDPEKRDPQRAVTLAQRAANAANDNPRMWRTLALAQLRIQQLEDCRQSLQRARLSVADSTPEQLFLESLLAAASGDRELARQRYQQADKLMLATAPGSPRWRLLKAEAASALKLTPEN